MEQSSSTFSSQGGPRKWNKVERSLIELFNRQQLRNNFPVPHIPIPMDQQPSVLRVVPVTSMKQSSAKKLKKAIDEENPPCEAAVKQQPQHYHQGDADREVARLQHTIATYEVSTNELMQLLRSERESFRVANKNLQATNELLRKEVARIEKSFHQVLRTRDEEMRLLEQFRTENSALAKTNLQLKQELQDARMWIERKERQLQEEVKAKDEETKGEAVALREEDPQCSRLMFLRFLVFSTLVAICVAALLKVTTATSDTDCEYATEALDD